MMRKWIVTGAGLLWIALGIGSGAGNLWAAPQAATGSGEARLYAGGIQRSIRRRTRRQNPQQKIKLLDAFVKAYPNSTLMPYIYRDYYTTYMALKNFAQAIEYADRMIALGDKIDATGTPRSVLHPGSGLLSGGWPTRTCKLRTRRPRRETPPSPV